MNAKRALEYAFGSALLLGPLVYALSLPTPSLGLPLTVVEAPLTLEAPSCEDGPVSDPAAEPEVIVIGVCEASEPEPEPAAPPSEAGQFLFVNGPNLVFSTEAEARWGRGALIEPAGEAEFRAGKRAKIEALPSALAATTTRSYDLYGREGKLCTATVGEVHVLTQYGGPTLQDIIGWEAYEDQEDWGELPIPRREMRRALWDSQPRWLVGEFVSEGDCEGALWARDSALPAPTILHRAQAPNPFTEARLAAFASSPERDELEKEYRGYWDELEDEEREWYSSWEAYVEEAPATASSWLDARGEPQVVQLEFGYDEGCGGIAERYTSVHEIGEGGELVESHSYFGASAIFDADLDGELEYLHFDGDLDGWSATLSSQTERLQASAHIGQDWFCPC